jgi:hypothetical protein
MVDGVVEGGRGAGGGGGKGRVGALLLKGTGEQFRRVSYCYSDEGRGRGGQDKGSHQLLGGGGGRCVPCEKGAQTVLPSHVLMHQMT